MRALALEQRTTDPTEGTKHMPEISPLTLTCQLSSRPRRLNSRCTGMSSTSATRRSSSRTACTSAASSPCSILPLRMPRFPGKPAWKSGVASAIRWCRSCVPFLTASSMQATSLPTLLKCSRHVRLLRYRAHRATLGQSRVQSRAVRCVRVRHREGVGGAARRARRLCRRGNHDIRALGDRSRKDARRHGPRQGGTH